ncbi:MAG: C2 family cysteine protease, partial [Actinomycetia bacterium]|nr:C2 family cysteine protease [Actinomycetes bacterium]
GVRNVVVGHGDDDFDAMLRKLEKFGELPPGFDIEATLAALEQAKGVSDDDYAPFEMQNLLESLKELSPAAFDYLVMGLSDDQLAALDERSAMRNVNGLSHWGQIDFHSLFLSNVSGPMLNRVTEQWPSIEPELGGVDSVEDGDIPLPHWGDPPDGNTLYGYDEDGNLDNSADDVDQGSVGDCWMQAKMAALAQEHPEWVTDHVEQNSNGTITITMYDSDGNAHEVTVTDQIPVDDDGDPVYSGNSGVDSNWSTYYEKAFALASQHGSDGETGYGGIEGGWGADDAQMMTGEDPGDIDNEGGFIGIGDHESMSDVREHFENGDAVVIGMNGDTPPDEIKDTYHGNHEYYVKGFTDDGKIILGNPWGENEPDLIMTEEQFNEHCYDAAVINQ